MRTPRYPTAEKALEDTRLFQFDGIPETISREVNTELIRKIPSSRKREEDNKHKIDLANS